MLADKARIAALIPHAGNMCLLDGVMECDAQRVRCVTRTHLDPANPLRTPAGLHVLCGIEYAAQAMAVHGGMTGGVQGRPRAGYLAGVREVVCAAPRLDTLASPMTVEAERLMGSGSSVMYQFRLSAGNATVLQGRATVVLDAEKVAQ